MRDPAGAIEQLGVLCVPTAVDRGWSQGHFSHKVGELAGNAGAEVGLGQGGGSLVRPFGGGLPEASLLKTSQALSTWMFGWVSGIVRFPCPW